MKGKVVPSRPSLASARCGGGVFTRLVHGVHPDPRAVNLDLVGIHGSVGDQDLRVLDDLRLSHPDFLVQDEATRHSSAEQAVNRSRGGRGDGGGGTVKK